jgi:carbon storage regulator
MLILTRKPGESLYIGDSVKVTIVEIKGNQIRVGIDAPSDLRIYREEIYLQILDENKKAAEGVVMDSSLDTVAGSWKFPSQANVPRGDKGQRGVGSQLQAQSPSLLVKKRPGSVDRGRADVASSGKGEDKK